MNNANSTQTKAAELGLRDFLIGVVFPELRKRGIVARARLACCTTCASYEMGELLKKNSKKVGGVYWHAQDEEILSPTRNIPAAVYLGFGSSSGNEEDTIKLGSAITETIKELADQTVKVTWDGTVGTKIYVEEVRQ